MNMKLNKYLCGLLVAAIGGLTSCNTDVEGEYFPFSSESASFEVSSQSVQVANTISSATIPVSVIRSNTANALNVNITTAATHDGIFSNDVGNTISFAPGQSTVTFNVTANNLEKEVPYSYTISLDGNAVIDTLLLQTRKYEKIVTYFPADTTKENSKDSIAVDSVLTDYYVASPSKSIQISVMREGDWVSLGTGLYREDLIGTWFGVETQEYSLEIREHETKKGVYRVINPYGAAYPYNDPGDWDDSKDYYIEINAQDPDFVYVETSELGFDWGYGMFSTTSYVAYLIANGNSLETIKSADPGIFGKLKDGIITMPASGMLLSMADYNGGGWSYSNLNGLFRVALPGAVIADYSSELSYVGIFTNPDNEVFALGDLTLGPDASEVKAVVMSQSDDADAVADAIASGDLEAIDVEAGRIEVPIPEGLDGKLQLIVVVLADGAVQSVATANFEYFSGANPWVSLGTGYLVDDFMITSYIEDRETRTPFSPKTYAVEIQENKDQPGLYRIVDAFKGITEYANFFEYTPANIDVNATDPNNVYIEEQATGLDDGDGPMSIITYGAYMLNRSDFESLASHGYFGKLENGVIEFPVFRGTNDEGEIYYYQGICFQGSGGFYVGSNGAFKIVLPGSPLESAAKKAAVKRPSTKVKAVKTNVQKIDRKAIIKSMVKDLKIMKKAKVADLNF